MGRDPRMGWIIVCNGETGMSIFNICTDRITIQASAETVWNVLTDVDRYGEWNTFTSRASTDFQIGSPAHLLVRMGPGKFNITETVFQFDKPRLLGWNKVFVTRWLLFAMREQILEPVGETCCTYHNVDRLSGLLAPLVWLCFGGYMRRGFTDVGVGLKSFVETGNAESG